MHQTLSHSVGCCSFFSLLGLLILAGSRSLNEAWNEKCNGGYAFLPPLPTIGDPCCLLDPTSSIERSIRDIFCLNGELALNKHPSIVQWICRQRRITKTEGTLCQNKDTKREDQIGLCVGMKHRWNRLGLLIESVAKRRMEKQGSIVALFLFSHLTPFFSYLPTPTPPPPLLPLQHCYQVSFSICMWDGI